MTRAEQAVRLCSKALPIRVFQPSLPLPLVSFRTSRPKVVHEILAYGQFASWWVCLGIASSIGFGSGLHTFVLYLGPHVARFTLKSTACGRTDLKSAPYDTMQWGLSDSWSAQPCQKFGQPMYPHYPSEHGGYYGVPLEQVLRVILPEAVLWGIGTAIGELPPFMVARAGEPWLFSGVRTAPERVLWGMWAAGGALSTLLKRILVLRALEGERGMKDGTQVG